MKSKNNFLDMRVIISIVFFISCASHINSKIENGDSSYKIDLDNIKISEEVFHYSQLYKGIKTIVLETNKSCLIGMITKMYVYNNHIFILDNVIANSLYVFTEEGRFVRKIGGVGQGPGEYVRISDFTVDIENKIVFVLDTQWQRINKYDMNTGRFIDAVNLEKNARCQRIEYFGGKLYTDFLHSVHSDDNYLLRSIKVASGKEENRYLNVLIYHKGVSNMINIQEKSFFFRENGNLVFAQSFMDYLIEISKDGIFSIIEFKGKELLTSKEIERALEKGHQSFLFELLKLNKYWSINNFIDNNDWIYFEFMKGHFPVIFFINKKTKEVHIYNKLREDLLTSGNLGGVPRPKVGCYDKNGVYGYIHHMGVPKIISAAKEDVLTPTLDKLEEIKELDEEANPIIFYYEFKD